MNLNNLPEIYQGKLIPKNFGHIKHLKGSKMIDRFDSLAGEQDQYKFTVCKRDINDRIIITEKIDGMNSGVVKKNGVLYPVNRKGYDVRFIAASHSEFELLAKVWSDWVNDHYELYDSILEDDERLVFENAILCHTVKYVFKKEPVFLLAKYNQDNKRINHDSLTSLCNEYDIQQVPVLNIGSAIPPEIIVSQYPDGVIGARNGIEGIVYSYEHNNEFESNVKFVSNPLIGTMEPQTHLYNRFKR